MSGALPVARYEVVASNLSRSAENRIHDDTVAKSLGFSGALVPGVEVYAYACHPILDLWGKEWLERGSAKCRLKKPVYDGRVVKVGASRAQADHLSLALESDGVACATVDARLDEPAPAPPAAAFLERPIPTERPDVSEAALAEGTWLGTVTLHVTHEVAEGYRTAIHDADPLYARERIVHPGQILRLCNQTLVQNVVLGVWIHTGSDVTNLGVARVGETLSVRAKVVANYDRRGHRCVDLDCLVLADAARPIARVLHTAIYRLRPGNAPAA